MFSRPLTNIMLAILLVSGSQVSMAGLWRHSSGCTANDSVACDCGQTCCKTCVGKCKSVTVKKQCWITECEDVCIPPVQLPCCLCLFQTNRQSCRSGDACSEPGCADQCRTGCSGTGTTRSCCRNSFLRRVFAKCAGCRVRSVNRLKSEEYECQENVMEWKAEFCGPCERCCGDGCGGTGCGQ